MRDTKTLLQIVIDSLKRTSYAYHGICAEIDEVYLSGEITHEEHILIEEIIFKNKPSSKNKFKNFTKNEYWLGSGYWWKTMYRYPNTRQIRIDYLTQLKESL